MTQKKSTEDLVGERPAPEELVNLPRTPINIVVDNVRSLDNVGMIFRLCELARIKHLYLTGYTGYPEIPNDKRPQPVIDRHNSRITKTAVYALPYQPWSHIEDPIPLVRRLKDEGNQIIALEQTDDSVPYNKLPKSSYQLPITLILGHERLGVRDELLAVSDILIEIPILGIGNSHNVAASCGIVLYHMLEITKQI